MNCIHLTVLLVMGTAAPNDKVPSNPPEQLIVFVAPDASKLSKAFQAEHLPEIREVARGLDLPIRVIDIRDGAPPEVALTPLLVFQDYRGRSIYQGRYTGIDRIRNFLRTSRMVPQGDEPMVKRDAVLWRIGRTRVAGLLKIAAVTGNTPPGYDNDKFTATARRAILSGFHNFKTAPSINLRRSDRMFYLDFNPWLSGDGTLFLSVSLYSQFHCKEPIFTRPGESFTGPWRDRDRLFVGAAAALEEAVNKAMSASPVGDGFDPVPSSTRSVTWSSLGLELPPRPSDRAKPSTGPVLGPRWALAPTSPQAAAQLTFHFPAPLDSYSGEVGRLRGELTFSSDLSVDSVRGFFEADPSSVTMGDPDLDHTLLGKTYLDQERHPTSRFTIESAVADHDTLAYGRLTTVTMRGMFSMKGVSVPLTVRSFFEPVIGAGGNPELLISGRFQISLTPFSLDGPDGPTPAKETLVFDFEFRFSPVAE